MVTGIRPDRRFIACEQGSKQTTALIKAALTWRKAHDEGKILAFSAHRHAVSSLRRQLYKQMGEEIPTTSIRRRAIALLEQFPEVVGLPNGWRSTSIVSMIDRRYVMRQAWANVGHAPTSLFHLYGAQPGALEWLARIFDRFADWAGTTDPSRLLVFVPADPGLSELWHAYGDYLRLSRQAGFVAFQEVVPRALDALRHEDVRQTILPDLLLLEDVDLMYPAELLFARALVEIGTSVIATARVFPEPHALDPRQQYLAAWCAALEMEAAGVEQGTVYAALPHIAAIEHASLEQEVEAIARDIIKTVPPGGRFADYAVVAFTPELIPLLRRVLPRWKIPVDGMEARDAYTLALAPLILIGCRLIAGTPLPTDDFVSFVGHPLLGLSVSDRHLLANAVTTGLVEADGKDGVQIATLLRHLPAGISAEGQKRLWGIARVNARLRALDMLPSAKLHRWLVALGLYERAVELEGTVLEPWALAANQRLLERWLSFLHHSEQVRARLGETLSDDEAADVLRAAQALVEPEGRPNEDAVQVWHPDELGGCDATVVWAAGLHEYALPHRPEPLPWVVPDSFLALSALPGFIPPDETDRATRWQQAMDTLWSVSNSAREWVTFSWSATDQDGRRRLISPALQTFVAQNAGTIRTAPQAMRHHPPFGDALIHIRPPEQMQYVEPAPLPFVTSPSAIEDYLHCPRRYLYAREFNLYDVASSPRQSLGHVVHAALHDLYESGNHQADAASLITPYWSALESRFGTRLKAAAFRRMAEDAVANVQRLEDELVQDQQFLVGEAALTWQIMPDVELRGKIDRIDRGVDGLIVLDYKLGATSPSINSLLEMFVPPPDLQDAAPWRPSDLQLPLYILAIERGIVDGLVLLSDERVVETGLIFPLQLYTSSGKLSAMGRRMIRIIDHEDGCRACAPRAPRSSAPAELCRFQLERIVEYASMTIAQMRAGAFDPDPRDGVDTCRSCPFHTICPGTLV